MFTLVCQARGGRHQCSACLMSRFKHQQIKGSMIISKDNLGFDYRVIQKLSFQAPLHCNKGGSIWACTGCSWNQDAKCHPSPQTTEKGLKSCKIASFHENIKMLDVKSFVYLF